MSCILWNMMLINNILYIIFTIKFQWNFNEIFSITITLLVTLLVEFTYCISDISNIFLCWLDQFKILFPIQKLIKIGAKNPLKSIEISKTFDFYFRHRNDVFSRNFFSMYTHRPVLRTLLSLKFYSIRNVNYSMLALTSL